jgi:hypothetical protein
MFRNLLQMYLDIFRKPSLLSRKLWIILLVKLFIIFVIFKIFFFSDFFKGKTNKDKGKQVLENLTSK